MAVWGTGNVGRAAIRMIDGHPELELAAVVVSSDAKAGVDAGELAQLGRTTGVQATTDADEMLGSVDAVAYCASADFRPAEAVADILRSLSAGNAVVTPGIYPLYDPPSAPAAPGSARRSPRSAPRRSSTTPPTRPRRRCGS